MSRIKKHIDEVFREGLRSLSLLVSNKDLEAIDDKAAVYKDKEPGVANGLFDNFEIGVDESDWLKTKSKLELEKSAMSQGDFMSRGFEGFELEVTEADWKATYRKLQDRKRRRVAYWWWLSAGVVVLSLGAFLCLHEWSAKTGMEQAKTAGIIDKKDNTPVSKESMPSQDQVTSPGQSNTASADAAAPLTSPAISSSPRTEAATVKGGRRAGKTGADYSGGVDNASASSVNNSAVKPAAPDGLAETEPVTIKGNNNTLEIAGGEVPSGSEEVNSEAGKTDQTSEDNTAEGPKAKESEPAVNTDKNPAAPVSSDSIKKDDPKNKNLKKYALEPNRFHYYAGIVNQVGVTYRHLDKGNSQVYNQVRNDAERPFLQWTTGFELGVQRNGLRFGTGVQVTMQSWTSNYDYSYRIHDSIPVWDISHTVIKGYLLTRHRDTSMHEEDVVRVQKVQIPFEFSGLWPLSPRLSLVSGCGGLIGFTTRQTGTRMINPANNQLYDYSRLKDQENDFAFSVTGNAGLQYALRPKFFVMGSLYGNYSATSRFKSSFQARDFPYSVGISLKLLYLIR